MRNVLILGSGRSGTSMLAGTFAQAGWFIGEKPYPARASNPKGFFESPDVNGINEYLLAEVTPPSEVVGDWQRWLTRLPVGLECRTSPRIDGRIRALTARTPWCFKDPRFSYTLPVWRPHIGDALHVCVFRSPAVTARSIVKECRDEAYLHSLGMDFERALDVWQGMYRRILDELRGHGEWLFLHYDQVLTSAALERLEQAVGAPVCREFPSAALSRTRCDEALGAAANSTYAELCELAGYNSEGRAAARTSAAMPRLSVVVDGRGLEASADGRWDAWRRQSAPAPDFEVLWVAGAGSADAPQQSFTTATLRLERPGLGPLLEAARERARAPRILFLDGTLTPEHGCVAAHIAAPPRAVVLGDIHVAPTNALGLALEAWDRETEAGDPLWSRLDLRHASVPSAWLAQLCAAGAASVEDDVGRRALADGLELVRDPAAAATRCNASDWREGVAAEGARTRRALARLEDGEGEGDGPRLRWLRAATRAECEDYVVSRLPRIPRLEAALEALAHFDGDALGDLAALRSLARAASVPLRERLEIARREAVLHVLDAAGVASVTALAARRAWPLASTARRRVLAWPDWSEGDLEALIEQFGRVLEHCTDVCLCLRHDAESDGDLAGATLRLQRAYERVLPLQPRLEVVVVGESLAAHERPHLGRAVDAALRLPSSSLPERERFLLDLDTSLARSADELLALLRAAAGR